MIAGVLQNGTYAPILSRAPILGHDMAGMFYLVGNDDVDELASHYCAIGAEARGLLGSIETAVSRWYQLPPIRTLRVGDLRRQFMSDDELKDVRHLLAWDLEAVEAVEIRATWIFQHRDLHAGNVLISKNGAAIIIDYAMVDESAGCVDPLTLELAYIFNNRNWHEGDWPDEHAATDWFDLDKYLVRSPVEAFVRSAREWSIRTVERCGNQVLCAFVYVYCLRQLTYSDTPLKLAIAISGVAAERLLAVA
jgi:hypothetical protein